jgi:hypothetical protein
MRVEDDQLRDFEELAKLVDRLDVEASAGGEPYANVELDATLVAKRDRLLIELEVADVLGGSERARLVQLGLTTLIGYCDAAVEMDRYLDTPGYARLVKKPRVTRLLDSLVSLDWFRKPSGYVPAGVDSDDWLALCETNFRAHERPRAGSSFVRLEGSFHRLMFRTELTHPRLYRALPG